MKMRNRNVLLSAGWVGGRGFACSSFERAWRPASTPILPAPIGGHDLSISSSQKAEHLVGAANVKAEAQSGCLPPVEMCSRPYRVRCST
jgi:hypothetical protein